ncbi:MAG: hypothetical protein D6735_10950 [Acidobacteria bacterium]|nr:MAG: hypothetical protein D6735_10950 [Acidobacteriota bacterium]
MKEMFRLHPHYNRIEQELNDLLSKDDIEVADKGDEIIRLDYALLYLRELYNGDECSCIPSSKELCSFCKHLMAYISWCFGANENSIHVPVGMVNMTSETSEEKILF